MIIYNNETSKNNKLVRQIHKMNDVNLEQEIGLCK